MVQTPEICSPPITFGLKFLKIHEAASAALPPASDLSAGCLVG